jgi:hypothetical protein
MRKLTLDEQLMLKITNGGRTNLHEWFERIAQDYIEEQAIEDSSSIDTVKDKFYIDLHDGFLCTVPSLLHKFLLDKGVREDIVEYQPLLSTPPPNSNWEKKQRDWEYFLEANCKDTCEAWDFFLQK